MLSILLVSGGAGWLIAIIILLFFLAIFFAFVPLKLWFLALISGARVSMAYLVAIRLRRVPVKLVVETYIRAKKAGLEIKVDALSNHFMAGGNISNVVNALISAHSANITLNFDTAKAIDLAGRNVFDAVRVSITPKVIETPIVAAIAKDGIELRTKARVTVRTNISRLIGGAGEETIIARVGEGIVTTVGSALSHKEVLENPDNISKTVLAKGLDSGTAFEILSIDIADIDVGRNIGAQLQMDQAEADKRIAQAKAEERRAMAVASEQEMKAKTQEMRADVVSAEAEVPRALADAFRSGKLGVMDYYNMQNIIADTNMRNAIGNVENISTEDKGPKKK